MIINYKKYNCKSIYLVQFLLVRRQGNWKQTDQVSFHNSQAEPDSIIIGNQTDMVGFGWVGLDWFNQLFGFHLHP